MVDQQPSVSAATTLRATTLRATTLRATTLPATTLRATTLPALINKLYTIGVRVGKGGVVWWFLVCWGSVCSSSGLACMYGSVFRGIYLCRCFIVNCVFYVSWMFYIFASEL